MGTNTNAKSLDDSSSFCILPWIHQYVSPNGEVYPCCLGDTQRLDSFGNTKEQSLRELWNVRALRRIRRQMLENQKVPFCHMCYDIESTGNQSARQYFNDRFHNKFSLAEETSKFGELERYEPLIFDIRYSNLCNLRCRSCDSEFSSSIWMEKNKFERNIISKGPITTAYRNPQDLYRDIDEIIPHVQDVYFAGGEPMLQEEMYRLLERLIEKKRTDVFVRYSTNLTRLEFRDRDVLDLLKHFPKVDLALSLDAVGERASYIRKGSNWEIIRKNMDRVAKETPHVYMRLSSTVSMLNALHIPEFVETILATGHFDRYSFWFIPVINPFWLDMRIMPAGYKKRISESISDLAAEHAIYEEGRKYHTHLTPNLNHLVEYINQEDLSAHLPEFVRRMHKMDEIRNESILDYIPELTALIQETPVDLKEQKYAHAASQPQL